ncbi:TlpA family protein disulfide reductase [Anaerobacillus alkaliphilus]|uniref:TlpA family protein disulfide reductase n=1 Tax=Anaerobacillus alkaliphilus TaxID=1548597 RepID=A0A4Q0VNG4_9BACI|nr:TlpA disulfide reductase family protein [Anaerobacillus alkaliphilus]RXI97906.1 TlpA family protein disulfide reductase [Anaerobacillus alkaliphilus]
MLGKRILIIVNVVVVVFFLWMGQKQSTYKFDDRIATIPLVGYQAPSFTLETFDGTTLTYDVDLLGKPIFINFWASWCPPCKAEMPDLVEVANTFGTEITFIGINVATQDTLHKSKEFIEQYHVPYENLVDDKGVVSRLYQVPPIPTSIVIDKDGTIVYRKVGGMTKSEIRAAVQKGVEGGVWVNNVK